MHEKKEFLHKRLSILKEQHKELVEHENAPEHIVLIDYGYYWQKKTYPKFVNNYNININGNMYKSTRIVKPDEHKHDDLKHSVIGEKKKAKKWYYLYYFDSFCNYNYNENENIILGVSFFWWTQWNTEPRGWFCDPHDL